MFPSFKHQISCFQTPDFSRSAKLFTCLTGLLHLPLQDNCVQSLSCVQLLATSWTVACQAPLSMESSRQEYWNGLPFPIPEYLPNTRIKPKFVVSPVPAGRFFTTDRLEVPKIIEYVSSYQLQIKRSRSQEHWASVIISKGESLWVAKGIHRPKIQKDQ